MSSLTKISTGNWERGSNFKCLTNIWECLWPRSYTIKPEKSYCTISRGRQPEVLLRKGAFFSIWVFFHEHSRLTEQQGKGEGIYLTPPHHFRPLHRHLDISWVIAAESSPLHIAGGRNRTGNLWFPSASR